MTKIKQWLDRRGDMNVIVGFLPFHWELGFKHDKGLRRINVEFGPFAFEMTYW